MKKAFGLLTIFCMVVMFHPLIFARGENGSGATTAVGEDTAVREAIIEAILRYPGPLRPDYADSITEMYVNGRWAYALLEWQTPHNKLEQTVIVVKQLANGTWEIAPNDPDLLQTLPSDFLPQPLQTKWLEQLNSFNLVVQTSTTMPLNQPTAISKDEADATLTLDGVDLTVIFPDMPDSIWGISAPGYVSQIATISSLSPYREFSIQALPFDHLSGVEQELVVDREGGAQKLLESLVSFREQQGATIQVGPTATIFDQNVSSIMTVVDLNVAGPHKTETLIVEWAVEVGERIWLVRYAEEYRSNEILSRLHHLQINSSNTHVATTVGSVPFSPSEPVEEISSIQAVPFPPWWNGNCNVNNHPGSYQLASHNGLVACGPGSHTVPVSFGVGVPQLEWQCPELSKRFLYLQYGIAPYAANGSQVVWNYTGSLLQKISNGTVGRAPVAGNVLSYGETHTAGHTSVVTASNVNSNGNGTITVIEQNLSSSGYSTLSVNNWQVIGNAGHVSGWLQEPGTPSPTPTPAPSGLVRLYSQPNMQGTILHSLGPGLHNDPNPPIFSMSMPSGWSAITYDQDDGNGDSRCWSSNVNNFQDHSDWSNRLRSIRIYSYNACPTPTATPSAQVRLYSQPNMQGTILHSFGPGLHNDPHPPIFSMSMPSGWSAITYDQDDGNGDWRCWNSNVNNFQDHSDWSNRLRSIRVYSSDACIGLTPTPTSAPVNYVTMCTTDDASSGCWLFYEAMLPDLTEYDLNDQLRSVKEVPSGYSVLLFRDDGFRGTAECYNSPRIPLPTGHPWDLRGKVTGVHVFAQSGCPSASLHTILMYDGQNYTSHYWGAGFEVGIRNMTQLGGGSSYFNDHAESIKVPPGWSVKLYEHENGQGQVSSCLSGNVSNLGAFNNTVSSVEIFHTENCAPPPPDAPSDIVLTGSTDSSLSFAWQDNSNNETGFRVYQWGYDGEIWRFLYLDTVGANVTSYTDTGLLCDVMYFYEVTAFHAGGESSPAPWLTASTLACATATATAIPPNTSTPMPTTTASWTPTLSPPNTSTPMPTTTISWTPTMLPPNTPSPTATATAWQTPTVPPVIPGASYFLYLPILIGK